MQRAVVTTWLCGVLVYGACAAPDRDGETTPADTAVMLARPSIERLVDDIRSGLADIPRRVAEDGDASRRIALELYASRQELIEAHYGRVELDHVTEELADRVEDAERRFHALLATLSATAPDTAGVRVAVDSLFLELERVMEEARRAGVLRPGA